MHFDHWIDRNEINRHAEDMDLLRRTVFLIARGGEDGIKASSYFWTSSTEPDPLKQLHLFAAKTGELPQ